ncbi:CAP domain-containing protein [Streptomyces sp. NPDC056222]|uniref:CAP domain-containing protein n=1 Tax=Streptomyces sp. NPDC056222 TaxID=3345749 RepID=UPI0035D5F668
MNQGISTEQAQGRELVRAAMSGDPWARDPMIAAHVPLVYNVVGRALNGHHDVDGLVQETMLRALDGLGGLRDPDEFQPWLVAIAVDSVRTHMQRSQLLGDADGLPLPGPDFADLTIERLYLSGQEREAAEAARWIEPDDGVLLALWWLECMGKLSRYEIAAALQWPVEHTAGGVESLRARLDAARVVVGAVSADPLCPALGYEAGTWDGRPCAAWREHFARHAGGCAQCSARWRGMVPLEALLAGLPLVPPPTPLLAGVRESAAWALAATPQAATGTPDAYETPEPHREPWQYATEGRADWSDQNHDTDRYDHIASIDLTRPFLPGMPQEAPSVLGSASAAARAAVPGARGARNARRRRRQERERNRRRVVVTAGMAVVALTGGSFYLSGGRGADGDALEVNRAAAPAPDLPSALEATGLTPTPSTVSPSASASASASTSPSAKATPPTRTAAPDAAKTTTPRTSAPKPKRTEADTGTGSGSGSGSGASRQGDSGSGSAVDQVVSLVNAERAKAGCGPLTANSTLNRAAQGHSDDMAARDYFDHSNPDGDGPGERVTAAGYPWSTYGENIAMGQRTPEQVMDAWMNSPGHRANILNCDFKEIGIGIHNEGGPYWTQVFGARRG